MDPKRFKETYVKLELLEDRLSYKIRSRSVRTRASPSIDNLDDRLKDLAEFTLDLKDCLKELMEAIAAKPE